MKKIILTLIIIMFMQPVFSADIKDELLDSLDGNVIDASVKYTTLPIKDEIIEAQKRGEISFQLEANITDEAAKTIETEDVIKEVIQIRSQKVRKIAAKSVYNFAQKPTKLLIKLADNYNIKNKFIEGEHVPFEMVEETTIADKTFPKGTKVIGRIETFSASDKMGTPENIKIDNFYIVDENNKEINIHGSVSKMGANRTIWVYPLYQAGNFTFYVAGFIFVPIHGGKVRLSTKDVYTLFWEPQ